MSQRRLLLKWAEVFLNRIKTNMKLGLLHPDLADLWPLILRHLHVHDALQLARTSKELRAAVISCWTQARPQLRALVVASADNQVLLLDPLTGQVLAGASVGEGAGGGWPTSLAIDGKCKSCYVCQYQGDAICEFSLPGLGFQAAWEGLSTDGLQREGSEPEGVVVAQGRVYIAWASTGWITSHKRAAGGWSDPERLALGARLVPWGMRLGPDGALYVAVNPSYFQEGSYGDEPRARGVGTVMRVPLTETGLFASRARTFVNPGHLSRPSGLCFDSQGDLLVTHMGAQVLKFAGPLSKRPGSYLGVLIDTRLPQHGLGPALATCSMPPKPFDICWCGGMLFMTTHTCSVEGEAEHGKLSVWDESGVLLKVHDLSAHRHPNMLAVYSLPGRLT